MAVYLDDSGDPLVEARCQRLEAQGQIVRVHLAFEAEVRAEAGVPTGVSVSPQIPFVNDDMEQVLAAAYEAGASRAFYQVLRLPWELSPMFRQWLDLHYPDRAERVMARVQDLRGGKDYDADFATRMKGQGIWADLIRQRFVKTCDRLGFNREREPLELSLFRPAALRGQGDLF